MPSLTIQGAKFDIPDGLVAKWAVGYTLVEEGEAHTLQQTFLENVRNNQAKAVKAALNGSETLLPEQHDSLQASLVAYAEKYKFGMHSGRGPSGPRIKDPIEREMNKLAREDIAAAFYAKHGEKLKGDQLAEAATKLLEAKHDEYARRARRAVADREKAGMETLAAVGL